MKNEGLKIPEDFERTGEVRVPSMGEWFLCHVRGEWSAERADRVDLRTGVDRIILRRVAARSVGEGDGDE